MINGLKTTTSMAGGVIVSAIINSDGHLIITLSNGQQINTGAARGTQGIAGVQGDKGDNGIQGATGTQGAVGLTGKSGIQGAKGNDGQSFEIDRVGLIAEKAQFNFEPAGFSFLAVGSAAETTLLYIKRSHGEDDWFTGVPFAKPIQGEQGKQGSQGIQGERGLTGEQGRGLYPDQRGLTEARSIYDAEDPGFIFYDYEVNVFYVKLSHKHQHWSQAFSMMQGDTGATGEQGPTGSGIAISKVTADTFSAITFDREPNGTQLYSTFDQALYVRGSNGVWSDAITIKGNKGDTGAGLQIDTAILNTIELADYEKQHDGFMALHTPSQTLFIKNYSYPYPGQNPELDYSLPQYQTNEYKAKKQTWDHMSQAERLQFLWSSSTITQGEKGDTGEQGIQGIQGTVGNKGEQGTGFTPDYKDAGLTPRRQYDGTPPGTSYLDTTHGMLYFRQTLTSGQWGPAIPLANSGGSTGDVSLISHGIMVDPSDPTKSVNGHNVLKITSVAEGSNKPIVKNLYLSGTAYASFNFEDANTANGSQIVKFVSGLSYGAVLRPEIWNTEVFTDASGNIPTAKYQLYASSTVSNGTADVGNSVASGGIDAIGNYDLNPIIVDAASFVGLSPADTNISIYLAITFTNTGGSGSVLTAGALRFLTNIS